MSKFVKDLVSKEIAHRLEGVSDALLVNVVGLDAGKSYVLRKQLRQKNIHLLVIKNSLARRATEGTPLAPAFQGVEGTLAMVWGGEDFVSLAKEITALDGSPGFPAFQTRGGVMDGEHLSAERVKAVSLWPSRQEQISILLAQILSPGANLVSQLLGPGRSLASQIEKKSEGEAQENAGQAAEQGAEQAAEPGTEQAAEQGTEQAAEPGTEQAAEPGAEQAVEQGVTLGAEQAAEQVVTPGTEQAAEQGVTPGAEQAAEQGAAQGTQPKAEEKTDES